LERIPNHGIVINTAIIINITQHKPLRSFLFHFNDYDVDCHFFLTFSEKGLDVINISKDSTPWCYSIHNDSLLKLYLHLSNCFHYCQLQNILQILIPPYSDNTETPISSCSYKRYNKDFDYTSVSVDEEIEDICPK
jgi:hypothetical protein